MFNLMPVHPTYEVKQKMLNTDIKFAMKSPVVRLLFLTLYITSRQWNKLNNSSIVLKQTEHQFRLVIFTSPIYELEKNAPDLQQPWL